MNDNENKSRTLRGMIVLDQIDFFLVSITGHDKLYKLSKNDLNCVQIFEPLSRFEFDACFGDDSQISIEELIRFDNVLKIKHKNSILNLLALLQENLGNNIANIGPMNELQNIFKDEHIPFSVYGFDKIRADFWQLDLRLKIDELEKAEPGKKRDALIANLEKRTFMFENNPDQQSRYQSLLDKFKNEKKAVKESFKKDNRVLVAESEAPKVGEWVEFPFLAKLGKVLIRTVGKSFLLKDTISTVTEATKQRLNGKMVCWVYYEQSGDKSANNSSTAQSQAKDDDDLKPRSINELNVHFDRIKRLFGLDGIKPRNSTSYVGDFRTGTEICDMRHLSSTFWFVLSADNIWYLDGAESTALMHHNIQLGGRSYLGSVLARADYPDVVNTLNWLNESVIDIRTKLKDAKY